MATAYTDQVQKVYIAYYGRAADPVGLAYWAAKVETDGLAGIMASFGASAEATTLYGSLTNTAKVNALYQQSFGRDADFAGLMYYAGQLTAGTMTAATIAQNIFDGAAGSDATILANKLIVAKAYTTAVDTASEVVAYSGTVAAASARALLTTVDADTVTASFDVATSVAGIVTVSEATPAVAGVNYALTTGTDTTVGGAGNDTFDAGLSTSSLQTINSSDSLNGGAGADQLVGVITSSVTPLSLASIETVAITVNTAASTFDATNGADVTAITAQGATFAATLQGFGKTTAVTLRDSALAHTVTYNDVTGSADSATVNVTNMSQTTGIATTIAGVETLTLNVAGSAANIGVLTAAATSTLNVTGDKNLTIVDNLGTTFLTMDASASTGAVNVDFSGTDVTATGGTGADTFSFEAVGTVVATGGAGNDTMQFDATGTLTTADTVTGGDGVDTLSATSANLVTASAATPTTYNITGIETVSANTAVATGVTIDLTNLSTSANYLELTLANAGTSTFNFNAGSSTLENTAASVGGITVDSAGTATDDALTIKHGGASSVNSLSGQTLISTDFETITVNTTGTGAAGAQTIGAISMTASTGGTTSFNLTGSNSVTIAGTTANVIDASGLSGSTGVTMNAAAVGVTTITGSAGIDALIGDASSTINGGGGVDTITGGSGNDVINGDAGNDIIDSNAGTDTVNGGAGNDTVNISTDADIGSGDAYVGGAGTDTLAFNAVQAANGAAELQGVSGFEVLTLATTATESLSMSDFINNANFERVDFGQGGTGTLTVTNASASTNDVRMLVGTVGDSVVFDRLIDTSTNALTVTTTGNVAVAVIAATFDDEETLTFVNTASTSNLTVTTLNVADVTSMTVTGAGDFKVTNALSGTRIKTMDVSGSSGANEIHMTNNVVIATITGGTGADELTGGLLGDTITSGTGADIIIGGAGADTIVAGSGNDNITGGTGADIINIGSGTDTIVMAADGDSDATAMTVASQTASVPITGADVLTGMAAGDIVNINGYGYTAAGSSANNTVLAAGETNYVDGIVDNTFGLSRGDFVQSGTTAGTGTFIYSTGGADTLFYIDTNQAVSGQTFEAVVLVGVTGLAGIASGTAANTIITLS